MSARKVLVSVVVPCFNEEAVIGLTHRQLIEALGGDASFDLEIVYVNDGSHDRTEALLFELADQDPRVKVVSFTRNFGHQPAVSAGLEYAGGDAVAVIDADLQDPPEVILRLVAKWREGYDVVNAVREKRKEGLAKRLAYALFYKVYRRLASIDVPLDSGDFALMDRRVVDVMNALPEKNRFVRGLRSWSGFRQTGVAYERASRAAGETKYSFAQAARARVRRHRQLLHRAAQPDLRARRRDRGVAMFAGAGYLVARIFAIPIFGYTPGEAPGFTTLILTILFFSGVQLISIGILGEYLGRIYQETKMRPTFVVKEVRGGRVAAARPDRAAERAANAR